MKNFPDHFKYEFETLETIIAKDLARFLENECEFNEELIADFRSAIQKETDTIKQNMRQAIVFVSDGRTLDMYVQYHQQELIRFAGLLEDYVSAAPLNVAPKPATSAVFSHILYIAIESLLGFMEIHFPNYFDQNAWIPANYRRIAMYHITSGIEGIQQALLSRGAPGALVQIIFDPFVAFFDEQANVSYRAVIYLKRLTQKLRELVADDKATDIQTLLMQLLYGVNFNTPECVRYCIASIQHEYEHAGSPEDQEFVLARHRKVIQQIYVKPGCVLDVHSPSLMELVSKWIDGEAALLEKGNAATRVTVGKDGKVPVPIEVDLNGSELVYLIRLLVAVGIITNRSRKKLLITVARIFSTNTASDDEEYFRKSIYKVHAKTKLVLRAYLLEMIAFLDRDEGQKI